MDPMMDGKKSRTKLIGYHRLKYFRKRQGLRSHCPKDLQVAHNRDPCDSQVGWREEQEELKHEHERAQDSIKPLGFPRSARQTGIALGVEVGVALGAVRARVSWCALAPLRAQASLCTSKMSRAVCASRENAEPHRSAAQATFSAALEDDAGELTEVEVPGDRPYAIPTRALRVWCKESPPLVVGCGALSGEAARQSRTWPQRIASATKMDGRSKGTQ